MVTVPDDDAIPCAVYFADNMVFAPQWRVDNLVRIEMMILDVTNLECPRCIDNSTINLPVSFYEENYFDEYLTVNPVTGETTTNQQAFLMADSENVAYTSMVSVSYICVTITNVGGTYTKTFEAGWLSTYPYERVIGNELGREVNKHGNLIYGMLWDTAPEEEVSAPVGDYRVDVQLGKVVSPAEGTYVGEIGGSTPWYTVNYTVGHLYVGDGVLADDDHPYVSMVSNEDPMTDENPDGDSVITIDGIDLLLYADLGVGLGGVSEDTAWILLGPLIDRGPGGGSGDGGGSGVENGGNGLGNLGNRLRG